MRDKIKARLKDKFPGVNLSSKRLDEISDKLSKKITEESDIDAKLDELNEILPFAEIAKQDDRLRTLESKTKDKPNPSDNSNQHQGGNQQQHSDDDAPSWFKKHVEDTNKRIADIEARNFKGSVQQKLKDKLKDVPEKFYAKRSLPEKEEDFESFVQEIQTDYNEFKDEQVAAGLMSTTKPANGSGGASANANDKSIEADIMNWAKSTAPTTTTQTT